MNYLTDRELEEMFIECVQDLGDDEVEIFGVTYSKIDMLKDADPVHFNIVKNEYIYNLVQDELLVEVNGEYVLADDYKAEDEV